MFCSPLVTDFAARYGLQRGDGERVAPRNGTPEMATTFILADQQCQKPRACRCRGVFVLCRAFTVFVPLILWEVVGEYPLPLKL